MNGLSATPSTHYQPHCYHCLHCYYHVLTNRLLLLLPPLLCYHHYDCHRYCGLTTVTVCFIFVLCLLILLHSRATVNHVRLVGILKLSLSHRQYCKKYRTSLYLPHSYSQHPLLRSISTPTTYHYPLYHPHCAAIVSGTLTIVLPPPLLLPLRPSPSLYYHQPISTAIFLHHPHN